MYVVIEFVVGYGVYCGYFLCIDFVVVISSSYCFWVGGGVDYDGK